MNENECIEIRVGASELTQHYLAVTKLPQEASKKYEAPK